MTTSGLTFHAAWVALSWTMVHLLWVGGVIGLCGAAARIALRTARPEIRYGAGLACLIALGGAAILLFTQQLGRDETANPSVIAARGENHGVVGSLPSSTPLSSADAHGRERLRGFRDPEVELPRRSWLDALLANLPWLWLAGSTCTLGVLGCGLIGVNRMRRSARLLTEGAIPARAAALAGSLLIARRFKIAICERLSSPLLIGLVRPMILLPPAALYGWTVDQIEMVLLHELAHLRRHDNIVNLMQCLLESALFFHPAVWWLSAWVRLEREHCCDRLVVEWTGRSEAYAEMLADLSGTFRSASRVAVAMAERPVISRIRRILNMEDRPMRLTLAEGFGVIASAFVAGALVLGARAAQTPSAEPDGATRAALRQASRDTAAMKLGAAESESRGGALVAIAEAQLKLGDRAAALATMRILDEWAATMTPNAASPAGPTECSVLGVLVQSAKVRREAGDVAGSRALVERIAQAIPAADDPRVIAAFAQHTDQLNKERGADEQTARVPDMLGSLLELSVGVIEERIALGDKREALALAGRTIEAMRRSLKGSLKPMITIALSPYLAKAGAPDDARALVATAQREALALPRGDEKDKIVPFIPKALAKVGDCDAALALAATFTNDDRAIAFDQVIDALTVDDEGVGDLDFGGIKLLIGAYGVKPADSSVARRELPKIARAVNEKGDVTSRARTLSKIAHLLAKAGDFDAARQTTEMIPALRKSDFAGPSDGFYDAVKPATFGMIAGIQATAGDGRGADELFRIAADLAAAIEAPGQKMIAEIVLARSYADGGRRQEALQVVDDAIALAKKLPEPSRSRGLTMLVEYQAKAGDKAGALKTIEAIRDYPGLEKIRALGVLTRMSEQAGEAAEAKALAARAGAVARAQPPANFSWGDALQLTAFGRDTFIDFEREFDASLTQWSREQETVTRWSGTPGEVDDAVRAAQALPPGSRDFALMQITAQVAHRGDVARAMKLAATISDAGQRLSAVQLAASVVRDRSNKQGAKPGMTNE